jgi:hypothetical protein
MLGLFSFTNRNLNLDKREANYSMLLDWANPLTLEAFEELIRSKPEGLTLSGTSREGLIDEIVSLSHGDSNALRQLRFRLSTLFASAVAPEKARHRVQEASVHHNGSKEVHR